MADSPGSSQRTNEDPTGPRSVAARATATLTPSNAEAKQAFSDAADAIIHMSQHESRGGKDAVSRAPDPRIHARKYMWIPSEQSADLDVARLMRWHETGQLSSSSPNSSPSGATAASNEPNPRTYIWRGCYFLDLDCRPLHPARGWTVGRLNERKVNDLILSVGDSTQLGIRQQHCILQVHSQSGRIYVQKIRDQGVLEVNGVALSPREIHVLNKPSTSLRIGHLAYKLEYARFAYEKEYNSKVEIYIRTVFGGSATTSLSLTPTPYWATTLKVGQWTLTGSGTIGSGGGGRVSAAMNHSGEIVALKRVSATKGSKTLQKRINTLKILTELADVVDEDRILRLVEVITDDPTRSNHSADIWFALRPAVATTLYDHRGMPLRSTSQGLETTTSMIRSILGALNFLHSHQWIHGDIKPPNIGIRAWEPTNASVVLLDLDDAVHAPEHHAPPAPGRTGTVGWLSPERELTGFTYTADVWAVGVTAIWLLFGRHPWPCEVNPWRSEPEYARKRPQFHNNFDEVARDIQQSNFGGELMVYSGLRSQRKIFIHWSKVLGTAILRMIRHPYARDVRYRGPRQTGQQILDVLKSGD